MAAAGGGGTARAAGVVPRCPPAAQARAQPARPRLPVKKPACAPARRPPERRPTAAYLPAREGLRNYLTAELGWNARDAALLVEYASLDFGRQTLAPPPRPLGRAILEHERPRSSKRRTSGHSGPSANRRPRNYSPSSPRGSTSRREATTRRSSRPGAAMSASGRSTWRPAEVRPREIGLPAGRSDRKPPARLGSRPAADGRSDRLRPHRLPDPNAKLSPAEKASCEAVLKNLPVTFTFAPMNLLHYQVKFPAHGTRVVAVTYRQYAYADTQRHGQLPVGLRATPSQLWKDFGPIALKVHAPKGILCRASAATGTGPGEPRAAHHAAMLPGPAVDPKIPMEFYRATLESPEEKRGELSSAWTRRPGTRCSRRSSRSRRRRQRRPRSETRSRNCGTGLTPSRRCKLRLDCLVPTRSVGTRRHQV